MIAVILLIAFLITGCEDKSVKTDPSGKFYVSDFVLLY